MKNLQISDNDLMGNKFNGHDLHVYLREHEIDSKQLVWQKESTDNNTYEIARHRKNKIEIYKNTKLVQDAYSLNGILNPLWYDVLYDPLFLDTDLVHLHLVHNGLVDLQLLPLMSRLKPIIWTIHDPWALSGHCIEHQECEKWKSICKDCPYLKLPFKMEKDNSALNFSLKKTAIKNSKLEIIVASRYMFDKVKGSPIFEGKNIHLVPFGINQNIFKKLNKLEIRKRLNIPENSLVISFRSDTRYKKGVDYVENIIKNLKTGKAVYFVAFGGGNFYKNDKFKYIEYGWIKDDLLMADIYNISDLFLMPSTLESFGMMAIEAMCCGTLPIVLKGTALPETVNAPMCGVATEKNKEDYLRVVQSFVDDDNMRKERANKCFEFAKLAYNKDDYIDKIIDIYKTIIKKHELSEEDVIIMEQLKDNGIYRISNDLVFSIRNNFIVKIILMINNFLIFQFLRYKKYVPKKIRTSIKIKINKLIKNK